MVVYKKVTVLSTSHEDIKNWVGETFITATKEFNSNNKVLYYILIQNQGEITLHPDKWYLFNSDEVIVRSDNTKLLINPRGTNG